MWPIASVRDVRHLFLLVAAVSQLSLACEITYLGSNAKVAAVPGLTTLIFAVVADTPIEELWVSISNATIESSGINLLVSSDD